MVKVSQTPYCILVIDTSLVVRIIIKSFLAREDVLVFDFADGFQALRWLHAQQACKPDLILLDRDAPQLDWYVIAQSLQAQPICANAILVILSQRDGTLDRIKALLSGAQDYLTKPFRVQELHTVIQRCLSFPKLQITL